MIKENRIVQRLIRPKKKPKRKRLISHGLSNSSTQKGRKRTEIYKGEVRGGGKNYRMSGKRPEKEKKPSRKNWKMGSN